MENQNIEVTTVETVDVETTGVETNAKSNDGTIGALIGAAVATTVIVGGSKLKKFIGKKIEDSKSKPKKGFHILKKTPETETPEAEEATEE